MKGGIKYYLAISILIIFFILVLIERILLGMNFIADELFYLNSNIDSQSKRVAFIYLAQIFRDSNLNFILIIFLNFILMILCYQTLVKINKNKMISFFQCMYIPVIASFMLRDLYILYFTLLSIVCFEGIVKNKNKLGSIFILILLIIVCLDFRPQMSAIMIFALFISLLSRKLSTKKIFFIGLIISTIFLFLLSYILENYKVYGISMAEYLQSREERFDKSYSKFTILKSFLTHYFAPIPTSLIDRALYPDLEGIYRYWDDILRILYRTSLYLVLVYLLFNLKFVFRAIDLSKERFFYIFCISTCNAILYSVFSFGGGHERVKIISMLVVFYIASMISILKKEK